jgi:hypothetical protein
MEKRMNTIKKVPMMSWNDRFALIEAYNPTNTSICATFNLTPAELKTAMSLRTAGTFQANKKMDITKFGNPFVDMVDEPTIPTSPTIPSTNKIKTGTSTSYVIGQPETATKKVIVKTPKKRGRKGTKITSAFMAVTDAPVAVDQFVLQHSVSLAVLRQSKRFIEQMSTEEAQKVGKIIVKQDKETKTLMIWREDI